MTAAVTPVESVKPIRRGEGALLSRVQYARLIDVFASLSEEEWEGPTDCGEWDVRALASHVLGGLEGMRRPRTFVRQWFAAKRLGLDDPIDALNEIQIREYAALSGPEITARIRGLVEPALRMRVRTPWLLRHLVRTPLPVSGWTPLAWILDVVYTRDTFLHRVDVCRPLGREVVVDDVEQRIVAEMAKEWADRHGQPVVLRLTGPAGGEYVAGSGGPVVECDAVEFARAVSGRAPAEGLLATPVQV